MCYMEQISKPEVHENIYAHVLVLFPKLSKLKNVFILKRMGTLSS